MCGSVSVCSPSDISHPRADGRVPIAYTPITPGPTRRKQKPNLLHSIDLSVRI